MSVLSAWHILPKKVQQHMWWLIPGLMAAAVGLASRGIYIDEVQYELDSLDLQARLTAQIISERIGAVEAETLALARDLSREIEASQSRPAAATGDALAAFYDHAEARLPRSRAAALFWFPSVNSAQVGVPPSFPLRARAGARQMQLPQDLDVGQAGWTRHLLARTLTSNAAIATPIPADTSNEPPNSLLVLAPVLRNEKVDRGIAFGSRLQGYFGARVNLNQVLTALGEAYHIKVSTPDTERSTASADIVANQVPGSQPTLWSPTPGLVITQGLNWHVSVGKQSFALASAAHRASLATLVGGLIFSLLLLAYLRSRQNLANLQQAAMRRAEQRLRAESSMSELATKARGLGVFRLDLQGLLIAADGKALAILGRDWTAINTLGLGQWWLGLGERSAHEALEGLQDQTHKFGFANTMASLPDQTAREVSLSVNRIRSGDDACWVGVIEDLSARPWNDLELSAVMGAFEAAQSELSIWSDDLHCLKFNRAFAQAHSIKASPLRDVRLPDLLGPILTQHAALALQGVPQSLQLERTVHGQARGRMIKHHIEILRATSEHMQTLLLITSIDVTESNKARRRLEEQLQAFAAMFSRSTLAFFRVEQNGQVSYHNPAAAELLGWGAGGAAGPDIQTLLPADAAGTPSIQAHLQQEGTIHALETEFRRDDGSLQAVRLFASNIPGQAGAYWLVAEDRSQELAMARQRAATESVALMALKSNPQAVAIFNAEDELFFCNQVFTQLFRASQPARGSRISYEAFLREGLRTGRYNIGRENHEDWLQERLAAHGERYSAKVLALDDDNWVEQIEFKLTNGFSVLLARDATNEQEALELSKKSSEAKSTFLAAMSHEIRTPLNGILGMAQILAGPSIDREKRLDYAQTILDSGNVLLHLLNQALDLSKIEAGKIEIQLAPTDPAQLCRSATELFASNAQLKGLTLTYEWAGPEVRYDLDQTRLSQMLFNLVGNAVKFTENGGVRIEAKELRRSGQVAELEFAVIDTGPGVTEAQRHLLFQPFSQLENAANSNTGSAGLGLSIVRAMAEIMGGHAEVDSVAGAGARFFFTVTATLSEAAANTQTPNLAQPEADTPMAKGLRVILMEDHLIMRQLLDRMLSSLGADVVIFDNGQDGLDAITAGDTARVILLDLEMAGLGGLVVAEMIRAQEQKSGHAPRLIAAVTAAQAPQDRQACFDAGMDEVLIKPVSLTDLSEFLARALAQASEKADRGPLTDKEVAQVKRLWGMLKPQLEAQQYYAMNTFSHLFDLLDGRGFNKELIEAQDWLNCYAFEKVLQLLEEMMEVISAKSS